MHDSWMVNGPGIASNWAADRVGKTLGTFPWLDQEWEQSSNDEPLYFSGGMLYPFLFETCAGLVRIKEAAHLLAKFDDWSYLYDEKQLAANEIPVYAACFDDMFMDSDMARETASKVKGIKVFETNTMSHGALMSRPGDVLRELMRLRDEVRD